MVKHFDISAIQVPIVYNKYGDVDPNGLMYVLDENKEKVKESIKRCPGTYVDLVQPLVIRVHQGDVVDIRFTNDLCFSASMNIKALPYEVQNSDGAFVGNNESSLAAPGETIHYRWYANIQGAFHFNDLGNALSSEIGSNLHGLFGALVVEPPGSTWTDPQTGCPLNSGVFADIHHPFRPDFREFVTIFHDQSPVVNRFGETPIDPMTGFPEMTHSINYRAEPMRNKMQLIMDGVVCPNCEGEEVHHDSWVFGDPPPTILPRSYRADPVRWYAIHGGVQETHIFHLHLQQWLSEPEVQESFLNDARAFGPGETIAFDILYGAGSLQKAYGDVIYHCHLYPHFSEGMWGIQRIHDVLEDGSRFYPDGTPITPLMPLPDRPLPPRPTPERPGFPLFIPGKVGCISPVPPIGYNRNFPITPLEQNALVENAKPGALFVNSCPDDAPIRRYDIVGIQQNIVYNEANWHDPEGRFYVLAEDEAAIRNGLKRPEPLFIRAKAGECIEIHFTNKFPEQLGPNAFQILIHTLFASTHVHFVKFDVLSSDGANTGWNYFTGTAHEQTVIYRWYADVDLKVCFFHDHLFANAVQLHGLFGGLVVEPEGSSFFDSHTGLPITSGTQAIIRNPFIPNFREYCLAVHDWVPAYDDQNTPLNPPDQPGMMDDMGIIAFNYANAPFQIRGGDPAYVFSSYVHGDPWTPVFEGYAGDPVRVRLIDGAHEESHAINFNRYQWHRDRTDVDSPLVQSQHIGISEAFTFEFSLDSLSGNNDFDILYYSAGMDDLWLGTWGITRVHGSSIPTLSPLGDRPLLPCRTTPLPVKTGTPPPKATSPGNPFPCHTKVHHFDIAAIQYNILYNRFGDHDPYGMIFVPLEDMGAVLAGLKNPEPLIVTVNAGEGIELTLFNYMPQVLNVPQFPEVPIQKPWPYSSRVSINSQGCEYDVLGSDGATIGFNPDQTIGLGESITYRWFYPETTTQAIVVDFGDLMNHRKHGLFGAISLAEMGSTHFHPFTGKCFAKGEQLIISNPFLPDYRQFTLLAQNGIYLENAKGELLPKFFFNPELIADGDDEFDTEDQGMKGYNLRSEPFYNRLKQVPIIGNVFSSTTNDLCDISTPIFYAHTNDPITVKLLMPAEKPRATTFYVHEHEHHSESENINSPVIGVDGAITIGDSFKKELIGGATNGIGQMGDYMYQSANITWDIESGMWGIIHIMPVGCNDLVPLKD